jgi:hypothetical protein
MILVKFTNAHPDHRDNVLYINPEHVVSVREEASQSGGSLLTKIFVGDIEFTVEESLNETIKKLIPPLQASGSMPLFECK